MSDIIFELKQLIKNLHFAHGGDGNAIECIQCVVAALDEYERIYVQRVKNLQGGVYDE